MIRLAGVEKRYGEVEAVRGIDLEIAPGECFGLLGPNGAGKTTTLKMILGLTRVSGGEATVFGERVDGPSPKRHGRIGVVFETANIYDEASVEDNIAYAASLFGAPDERIDAVIERFGLEEHRRKKGSKLSKGLRQRTALARAVVHDPELLILDEPTSGLDPDVAQQVREIVAGLHGAGKTILLISHLMQEVEQLCSRVAIIKDGVIRAEGSVSELKDRYTDQVTLELRGSAETLAAVAAWNGLRTVTERPDLRALRGDREAVWPVVERLVADPALLAGVKELRVAGMSFEDVYIQVVNEP